MVLCSGLVQSYQGLGIHVTVPWNSDAADVNSDPSLFLPHCVSVDLEVDPKTARVFAFAAVRGGGGDLRHTFASLLVSGGASLEMIWRLLGHTQIGTAQQYTHLIDSPLRAGVNAVGEMLKLRFKVVVG
jgi:hypothetical protein